MRELYRRGSQWNKETGGKQKGNKLSKFKNN